MLHASTFDAARRNISRWAGTALLANKTDGAVYLPSQSIPVTDLNLPSNLPYLSFPPIDIPPKFYVFISRGLFRFIHSILDIVKRGNYYLIPKDVFVETFDIT